VFCEVMRMTDDGQSPSKRFFVLPHCPNCGTETPLHAQICPSCGSSMKVRATPQEASELWDEGSWQEAPPRYGEVRKPVSRVRRHRFHLRPQLIGTILLVIVAFSAGLAIGPYITPYRSTQNLGSMTITVVTTVENTLFTTPSVSTQVYQTTSAATSQTPTVATTTERPKWISSSTNVVSYLQAASYVGQSKTVEGTIVRTFVSSKGTMFLDFHDPYQGYFQVTIFASDVKNFPSSSASFYLNKEVRVTGTIELYQGAPEIIAHSPSQIEVAYMGFNYP